MIMELDEAPSGWFRSLMRFRIDQDVAWQGDSLGDNKITMTRNTSTNVTNINASSANWDAERFRGVGAVPTFGGSIKIRKIYLDGDGNITPERITRRDIPDVTPPRTGAIPLTTTGAPINQYTGTVTWNPNHTVFQANTDYTATITLTPGKGYFLDGITANWFRVAGATVTHAAGSGIITAVFPRTAAMAQYQTPTQYVAFTFDDSPREGTNALMDVIEHLNAGITDPKDPLYLRVTFFVNGINLERTDSDTLRAIDRMKAGGHQFGNHAWQHERWGAQTDLNVMRADFQKNLDAILRITGQTTPWIRLPYNSQSTPAFGVQRDMGLVNVRGFATDDWDLDNSASWLVNRILTATGNNRVTDGQIYTWHDQPGQTNTARALPEIVHELRNMGVGFMTLSELRQHRNFTVVPGTDPPYVRFF